MFSQAQFNQFILDNNVIHFSDQPITLKSGRASHVYINWRTITNDAYLLNQLTDYIIEYIKKENLKVDCFYGVPEGATKTAIIASLKIAQSSPQFTVGSHSIPMGRAKPKEHGEAKDKFFIGVPEGNTLIIEDVTTTGGSLIESIMTLKHAGIKLSSALTLTDRKTENVKEKLAKLGLSFHAMSTADQLIAAAIEKQKPSEMIMNSIKEEFKL